MSVVRRHVQRDLRWQQADDRRDALRGRLMVKIVGAAEVEGGLGTAGLNPDAPQPLGRVRRRCSKASASAFSSWSMAGSGDGPRGDPYLRPVQVSTRAVASSALSESVALRQAETIRSSVSTTR
jgi:hypothetical protein